MKIVQFLQYIVFSLGALAFVSQALAQEARAASTSNEFVTVVFGVAKNDRHGSMFDFRFEDRKEYEDLVLSAARQLRPSGLLGRMLCGDMDPVACGQAHPSHAFYRPEFFVLYDGDPADAAPVARKFFEVCSIKGIANPCLFSRPAAGYDETALQHFPPGAKHAVIIGGKLFGSVLGASMTLCYNGACDPKDVLDEAFWSGLVPILNHQELNRFLIRPIK